MRRSGMSHEEIDTVRWCHRVICRSGLGKAKMLDELRTRESSALVREYIEFVTSGKRGLSKRRGRKVGGTEAVAVEA